MQDLTGYGLTEVASIQARWTPDTWYELGDKAQRAGIEHVKHCDYCDYDLGNHCPMGLALVDIMHGLFALSTHKF